MFWDLWDKFNFWRQEDLPPVFFATSSYILLYLALYCFALYCIISFCIVLCFIVLYIVLHWSVVKYSALHHMVLHCIVHPDKRYNATPNKYRNRGHKLELQVDKSTYVHGWLVLSCKALVRPDHNLNLQTPDLAKIPIDLKMKFC